MERKYFLEIRGKGRMEIKPSVEFNPMDNFGGPLEIYETIPKKSVLVFFETFQKSNPVCQFLLKSQTNYARVGRLVGTMVIKDNPADYLIPDILIIEQKNENGKAVTFTKYHFFQVKVNDPISARDENTSFHLSFKHYQRANKEKQLVQGV